MTGTFYSVTVHISLILYYYYYYYDWDHERTPESRSPDHLLKHTNFNKSLSPSHEMISNIAEEDQCQQARGNPINVVQWQSVRNPIKSASDQTNRILSSIVHTLIFKWFLGRKRINFTKSFYLPGIPSAQAIFSSLIFLKKVR